MSATALRPLSLGELLDRCFFLYRKHFLLFLGIVSIPSLVLLALELIGVALNPTGVRTNGYSLGWTFFTYLGALPVVATYHGAVVLAVSKVHLGQETTVSESLSAMKGKIVHTSLILLGVGIGTVAAFILLIVPGIIVSLMWALAIPVTVLEDTGLRDTVARSAQLTKGSRGRVFVILVLFAVLFYMLLMLIIFPLLIALVFYTRAHGMQTHAGFPTWYLLGAPIGSFISTCLAGSLLTIALSVLYYDQKVRKEAFDIQLMMSDTDAMPPAASATPNVTTLGLS